MILIDTNVFSELVKPRPDDRVVDWLHARRDDTLLSTIVIAELEVGIRTTRGAGKRALLAPWLQRLIDSHEGRILAFDAAEARRWGELAGRFILSGLRSDHFDSMIAAQALVRGVPVATRNIRDFERTGVELVDPWAA